MKSLNPASGLKQITNGYLHFPRIMFLKLIKSKKLKPVELGYFIIFLISADWDSSLYRKGFIRHALSRLSKIWGIPYTTLYDYVKKLTDAKLLTADKNTPKINNFEHFESKGAKAFIQKNKLTDQELKFLFPKLLNNFEISEKSLAKKPSAFKDYFNVSSKVESNVYPKRVIVKQGLRTNNEYKKTYNEDKYTQLTIDGMKWIDENVIEAHKVKNEATEFDFVEIFFGGDWDLYQRNLITM